MNFRIGQKIVCVDASLVKGREHLHSASLEKEAIYTVRENCIWLGENGVLIEEIISAIHDGSGLEYGYRSQRFRPLTDISIFTAMLKHEPVEALSGAP